MSKAEERAFSYQRELGMIDAVSDEHIVARRMGFYDGYRKAEKDLALTWEDIKTIVKILADSDWYDFEINGKLWSKEFYEEVLKRFKERKNDKV